MISGQPLVVYVDTREQTVPPFPVGVTIERWTLAEGDYTTAILQGVAVLERKSINDFASSISHERERFDDEIRRLRGYRWKAIIVEGDLSSVYRESRVHPNSVLGSIASSPEFCGDGNSASKLKKGPNRWALRSRGTQ